ncbi:MAG: T9SS type A sorting domain-containing protein, partial [Ignavibacteria bacterium]
AYFYPWGNPGTGTITVVAKRFTNPSENYTQTFGAIANPIGIKLISSIVKEFSLNQNYPNPFNPTTNISFSIPTKEFVYLRVYDFLGREVKTLINQDLSPGEYEYEFEADNMSSGFYYYSLRAGENVSVKKMVLVK